MGWRLTEHLRCRETVREEGLVIRATCGGSSYDKFGRVDGGDVAEEMGDLGSADADVATEASASWLLRMSGSFCTYVAGKPSCIGSLG